jgi:hypothetical protein
MNKEITEKTQQLLVVLREELERMRVCINRIQHLKSFVITRKDSQLQSMLEEIRNESGKYDEIKLKRSLIRQQLAGLLGCSENQVTLSLLLTKFGGGLHQQIAETREKLKKVTSQLTVEHKSTTHLLCECTRFNRMLLNNLMNLSSPEITTYDSAGQTKTSRENSMMDVKF